LETNNKPLRPILRLGGKTPRLFLNARQTQYYKNKDGESKSIDCSILERERGYINEPEDLPVELCYPALCALTFDDIPDIEDPAVPANAKGCVFYHSEYTNSELAKINKLVNNEHGTTYPEHAKTIKRYRDQSKNRPGIVPYCHEQYEETPIGRLLEDHPIPGRAALHGLFCYILIFYFKRGQLPRDAPTRKYMIKMFARCPRERGASFPKEDLAEKQFDLLVEYGIITGLKGHTNGKHLLYYATQKSGPHQLPRQKHGFRDLDEYYISNNK
jgi:hypothetical protein